MDKKELRDVIREVAAEAIAELSKENKSFDEEDLRDSIKSKFPIIAEAIKRVKNKKLVGLDYIKEEIKNMKNREKKRIIEERKYHSCSSPSCTN